MSPLILLLFCGCLSLTTGSIDIDVGNRELLITVKQREDGISLTIIPETDRPENDEPKDFFETKNVPGVTLSPDCGHDYFRCSPKVLPSTITQNENDVLIPLNRGLLVVEVKFSDTSSKATFESYAVIDAPRSYCSPTTFFEMFEKLYTMCTDLQNKIVALFEIQVNTTAIKQSQLIGPLFRVTLNDFDVSDVKNISNFLLSTAITNQPLLYFAIDNYLYVVNPTDGLLEYGPKRIGTNCRHIHRLVSAPQARLLAYCLSGYVYYDIEQETWLNEYTYAESGVPYLCPDQNYVINAHDSYLSYSVGTVERTMPHVSVASGMCINGSEGVNIFAYNDKNADSAAFIELAELSTMVNKTTLCLGQDYCLPIIALGDPPSYLLIRQRTGDLDKVALVSVEYKAKSIISVSQEASDMYALAQVKAVTGQKRTFSILPILAGVLSTIVAVTASVLVIAGFAYICYRHHQCRFNEVRYVTPISENEDLGQGASVPVGQYLRETHPQPPIPVSLDGQTATSQGQPGSNRLIEDENKKSPNELLKPYAAYSGKSLDGVESISAQASITSTTTCHITNVAEVGTGTTHTLHTVQASLTQDNEMSQRTTAHSEYTATADNNVAPQAEDTHDSLDVDNSDTYSNESAPLINNDHY